MPQSWKAGKGFWNPDAVRLIRIRHGIGCQPLILIRLPLQKRLLFLILNTWRKVLNRDDSKTIALHRERSTNSPHRRCKIGPRRTRQSPPPLQQRRISRWRRTPLPAWLPLSSVSLWNAAHLARRQRMVPALRGQPRSLVVRVFGR